jgi:serine/threonine-protein kinase
MAGSFGDYELLGEVERGGMGVVYRARERHSGLLVALKMMLPGGDEGAGDRRRFVLEARATGELTHPGIVAIHAWGEHQGRPFYTMDFVPGVTLSRLLERGPLPCDRAVRYLLGIAHAVAAAHSLGIVHRDLKPSNVIIDLADQPRVLDFGLAKRHGPGAGPPEEAVLEALPADAPVPLRAELARRTEKGAILGTPSYMAPEQVRAEHERVGPPADVHALGAIFYEMVTGRPPFQGERTYETLLQVVEQRPAPLRGLAPRAPAVLEEFCRRCLEKDPRRRYPNAGALAEDLQRRWNRSVHAARFARLALGAGLALLLLALLGLLPGVGPTALGLEDLARRAAAAAPASSPVRGAVPALAVLLEVVVRVLAPYLAELALLVWLGAWAWNAERPWRLAGACAAVAAAVLALSACGLDSLRGGPLFLGWLLLGNAVVVLGVVVTRRLRGEERGEAESRAPRAAPYLQKLFAVRAESRVRAGGPREPRALGLADFELGKTLHRWDDHEVRWARQKSLDRATLVWLDHAPPAGVVPGVVVRHPAVLGLHAVGTTAGGTYLVTEPVPASPLSELLAQRGLVPAEAALLTARLARAVQAFHDQGACHGRLGAGWVLVRGDLEPVLCPCGSPSQAAEDRARDVLALGRLLGEWLPPRPPGWPRRVLAPLYRVADAAGAYARPADLADDVERAVHEVQVRWRQRWVHALVLVLLAVPLLFPAVVAVLGLTGVLDGRRLAGLRVEGDVAGGLLLALAPGAALLGYVHARQVGRRLAEWRGAARRPASVRDGPWLRLVEVLLLAAVAAGLAWRSLPAWAGGATWAGLLLVAALFIGVWALGIGAAGLMAYLELLFRSLHAAQHGPDPGAGPRPAG